MGVIVLTNSAISADDVGFHLIESSFPLSKPPVRRKEVAVDPELLAPLVGVDELAPTFSLTVTVEGGALWIEPTDQPKARMSAESDTVFFLTAGDAVVTFQKDANGTVTGLVLSQGGANTPGKKVR